MPGFTLPQHALNSIFLEMLGADINNVDPDCIIDTEKFIQCLRKEFEQLAR